MKLNVQLRSVPVSATSLAVRFIGSVIEKLQRHPKRVVFPEGTEPRVLQAARQFFSLKLGAPILLGDRTRVKSAAEALGVSLEGVRIINPAESEDLHGFAQRYQSIRRSSEVSFEQARQAMMNPNCYGAMMLGMHQVDGLITGASEARGTALEPLFQVIKLAPGIDTASSCMVAEVEDTRFGHEGVMFLADCGVIPDPTAEQLADIAVSTAMLARQLLGTKPRVALLSYSTKSDGSQPGVAKVQEAAKIARKKAREKSLDAYIDGELQMDAALMAEIGSRKAPDSKVAGRANVLIFPDLNSGNIASKLIQHVARANAYGQILLGMDRPVSYVSRGSTAHDILGVAAIVGVQSIAYQQLYPDAGKTLPGD